MFTPNTNSISKQQANTLTAYGRDLNVQLFPEGNNGNQVVSSSQQTAAPISDPISPECQSVLNQFNMNREQFRSMLAGVSNLVPGSDRLAVGIEENGQRNELVVTNMSSL